jgi:catechol 2,3-dioxygenase-like lactoylglutathione lyase family enzyme
VNPQLKGLQRRAVNFARRLADGGGVPVLGFEEAARTVAEAYELGREAAGHELADALRELIGSGALRYPFAGAVLARLEPLIPAPGSARLLQQMARDDRAGFEAELDRQVAAWLERMRPDTAAGRAELEAFARQVLADPLADPE